MESVQHLKKRLKSVQNINQITKAMELVAATKMRHSQELALASRPYALAVLDILANLAEQEEVPLPLLLQTRQIKKTLLVLVASDKGLAGSFNSSVFKNFEKFINEGHIDLRETQYACVAVGEKANAYLQKRGAPLLRKFVRVGDFTTPQETNPIADFLIKGYAEQEFDEVFIFSTHFRSALRQEVLFQKMFPVQFEDIKRTVKEIIPETGKFAQLIAETKISFLSKKQEEYLIEPSPEEVLKELVPKLLRMNLYHLILEANASEHAARRMAMKNASDNATEISFALQLLYNKSRQAAITREIIEITVGAESTQK